MEGRPASPFCGISATGLTAATPSRPAPSKMAPSHPRPKPTPKVGSVSVDAIRLAIREAISRRRPRARLARFCMPPLSRFISVRPAYLTRGATNPRHASTRTRRAVLPNTETLPNCVKPPSRGGASSACYGGPRVRILLSPAESLRTSGPASWMMRSAAGGFDKATAVLLDLWVDQVAPQYL
jgi:hypothetical protein